MDKNELERTKRQMVESAQEAIAEIKMAGKSDRSKIDMLKTVAMEQLETHVQQSQSEDTARSERRTELLRQLGKAAQSGNFSEMQRIKQQLEELA